jgi:hypothetical protein
VRNLGLSEIVINDKVLAQNACETDSIEDPECYDALLLALTPSAYSSNNTEDTPGGRAFISPARDQGKCSACMGFAGTAAAEAAVNVYLQQDWKNLSLSEQDFSFCR